MPEDRALGRRGEDIAQRFLQRAGIIVVDRNYRMASGATASWILLNGKGIRWSSWRSDLARPMPTAHPTAPLATTRNQRHPVAREYARHAEVPW